MTLHTSSSRLDDGALSEEMSRDDGADPVVASSVRTVNPVLVVALFAIAAILLFAWLNSRRLTQTERVTARAVPQANASSWAPPPNLDLTPTLVNAPGPAPFTGLPTQVGVPVPPPTSPPVSALPRAYAASPSPSSGEAAQGLKAPALVIDLGGGPREVTLAQLAPPSGTVAAIGAPAGGAAAAAQAIVGQKPQLSATEQFAQRVGDETPDRARAVAMHNLNSIAPQGTIIPGVLETAINSDLPGFTRAVVSRDVLSFDGRAVLIPRGSRLIGQYKSAVALGQSRAFIIWTRVIRPDGVSIQIGSPGTDELGRGGLEGEVDRHFFRRFSGSILLSVLNAAVAAVSRTPSTQITIGSPAAAAGAAAAGELGDAIPPTIKIDQGAAINIFVARDLDFSAVAALK